jgi:DNA-binding transcriptional ArsR family regulator
LVDDASRSTNLSRSVFKGERASASGLSSGSANSEQGPLINARDAEIVRAIEEEGLTVFTFDGLRRITGTHPETLSRSLERLEDGGILVRSPEGYSVAEQVKNAFASRPPPGDPHRIRILHTFLPYEVSAAEIVSALKGKWFDNIRWVGAAESGEGVVLKWVTEDGSTMIDARFSAGQLEVDARVPKDSDLPKAVRAAHQLMGKISRLYSSPRLSGKTTLMRIGYFAPYAM